MSSNIFGHVRGQELLARKFNEQGGCCWYTGRKLTPGVDASIDHTISVSHGGTNDESNLRWVHLKVNEIKRELSENDFYALCLDVVKGMRQKRLL